MGESRVELLAWLNDLSQLGMTKVEQCGSGAVHCVIMDSIYRDVPLKKVKFNAKHEYEYVANFKVLQAVFDKHKIDNAIPIERLVKCKMQDNLEFLQFMKKYWDQYYPGGEYDALARRAASPSPATSTSIRSSVAKSTSSLAASSSRKASTSSVHTVPATAAPVKRSTPSRLSTGAPVASTAAARRAQQELEEEYQRNLAELTEQTIELKLTVDQVEKEREFYFSKLREIELFVQEQLDGGEFGADAPALAILEHVQGILYKTEDGFEIPDAGEQETVEDEEETF
ncbi:hypothetical protein HDU83_001728 [Entophlyctis luteolus]|nr:hypothetical protein HDU83_001728 [Entophlyctis luteolus]KAJ3394078.1 hypothetical protein HDU84_000106 [Entophlyctis sp. JEL0112]